MPLAMNPNPNKAITNRWTTVKFIDLAVWFLIATE
jgi:hypothetical protein